MAITLPQHVKFQNARLQTCSVCLMAVTSVLVVLQLIHSKEVCRFCQLTCRQLPGCRSMEAHCFFVNPPMIGMMPEELILATILTLQSVYLALPIHVCDTGKLCFRKVQTLCLPQVKSKFKVP